MMSHFHACTLLRAYLNVGWPGGAPWITPDGGTMPGATTPGGGAPIGGTTTLTVAIWALSLQWKEASPVVERQRGKEAKLGREKGEVEQREIRFWMMMITHIQKVSGALVGRAFDVRLMCFSRTLDYRTFNVGVGDPGAPPRVSMPSRERTLGGRDRTNEPRLPGRP